MTYKQKFNSYFNSNFSKTPTKHNFVNKHANSLKSLFNRIPEFTLVENPEIIKAINPYKKPYFTGIKRNQKPEQTQIKGLIEDSTQKIIENVNDFKEMIYEFNKDKDEQAKNISEIKEDNKIFSKVHKKIRNDKNKFKTGTYLDYKTFLNISSRYVEKNMKIPHLDYNNHNIFAGSPLILEGSELENYFVYNLGDDKKNNKAISFLDKIDNFVYKKKTGNYMMDIAEMKRIEKILSEEKPKGYIPPEKAIKIYQDDIIKTKKTYNDLVNFERFFNDLKDKKNNAVSFQNNSSFNIDNSNNEQNNFNSQITNNNLNLKRNSSAFNSNNSNSVSTGAGLFQQKYIRNPLKKFTTKSNISSAISRDLSIRLQFSPIRSPLYKKTVRFAPKLKNYKNIFENRLNSTKSNFSSKPLTNLSLIMEKNNFDLNENKSRNILQYRINKGFNLFSAGSQDKNVKNNFYKIFKQSKSLYDLNSENQKEISIYKDEQKEEEFQKKEDLKLQTESGKELELQKEKELEPQKDKDKVSENSEIKEIKELNNEIKDFPKRKKSPEASLIKDKKTNNNDNKNNKKETKIPGKKIKKLKSKKSLKLKHKKNLNVKKLRVLKDDAKLIEEEERKMNEKYDKINELFESSLNNGLENGRSKSAVRSYLVSQGYDLDKLWTKRDLYLNLNKIKKIVIDRNYILEEYKIRNGENLIKNPFTNEQKNNLNKNKIFGEKVMSLDSQLKKLLCEQSIEK